MANDIFFGTGIAAIEGAVFCTDVFGDVREMHPDRTDNIANGKIGTPVAALKRSGESYRVYYLDGHNNLREVCQDGKGWYDGNLSQGKHVVAAYSSISCVMIHGGEMRVYAQKGDNSLQEYMWHNGKWALGNNFGRVLAGTAIAATSWADKHIR
ncbi:hypothetical protein CDD82_6605 [Ophiocordyceps australis]|uniref:Uncharacterized protein n=1 Tax=Ophiocordyceps australis TaxID=1399860 RepID=A0A2C5YUS2_9HYPO|nr:hypothetical protein CDD82_6605 [Ophiocordyceps australis]